MNIIQFGGEDNKYYLIQKQKNILTEIPLFCSESPQNKNSDFPAHLPFVFGCTKPKIRYLDY